MSESDHLDSDPAPRIAEEPIEGSVMHHGPQDWYPEAERLRWLAIADKIECNPSLLDIPLSNMERWQKRNAWDGARMFERWRAMILRAKTSSEGLAELLVFLRSDTEESRHWKDFDPFPGILTVAENRQFACTWGP